MWARKSRASWPLWGLIEERLLLSLNSTGSECTANSTWGRGRAKEKEGGGAGGRKGGDEDNDEQQVKKGGGTVVGIRAMTGRTDDKGGKSDHHEALSLPGQSYGRRPRQQVPPACSGCRAMAALGLHGVHHK